MFSKKSTFIKTISKCCSKKTNSLSVCFINFIPFIILFIEKKISTSLHSFFFNLNISHLFKKKKFYLNKIFLIK